MFTVVRKHEIHCGHRVYEHEGKCQHLHGHSYIFEFHCRDGYNANALDKLGRVIDFSEIKSKLCEWLEDEWDHRMLMWVNDPLALYVKELDDSVVLVPFNPTAENMADYLLNTISPQQFIGTDIICSKVVVHETGKCLAMCELN